MRILYNEEITRKDTYRYAVNQGGKLNIRVSNGTGRYVNIIFVDGKLEAVVHDFGDFDLRSNWHVYGAISEKITELEAEYKAKQE